MEERYIFTDVDGVLLDMNKAYWEGVSKVLGKKVWGANPHWDYRQTAGMSKEQEDKVWEHIWATPLNLYSTAQAMIGYLESRRIGVMACSVRPPGPARDAALRDFPKLKMPWHAYDSHKSKADAILRMKDNFAKVLYLEDKWDSADDMAREGVDTFLIDAPYNSSKDLDVRYKRIQRWELPHAVRTWLKGEEYGG